MKSKKIIILTAMAAIIACSKPVFAQEAANTNNVLASTSAVSTTQSDTTKISKEQAKQIAKDAFKNFFDITLDDSTSNININSNVNYYPGKTGKSYWDVNFNIDNGTSHCGGHTSIDKNTGKIVNLNNYVDNMTDNSTKAVATITEDQAKAAAEAFISKISPEEFKSTKLIENKKVENLRNQGFNFSYARLDNNIPVYGDNISVTVDRFTGKVCSYSIQWTDNLNLPSKDGIIDEKEGTDLVSKNTKMSLTYIPSTDPLNPEIEKDTKLVYTNDSDASNVISTDDAKKVFLSKNIPELMYMLIPKDSSSQTNEKEAKLVYSINNNLNYDGSIYVDAFTGKMLNYSGQDLDDNFSSFQNAIKGSSVEKEATILASNGIIDTKDFKLDGTITNLQFIKILTNIKNFNPYYGHIDNMDLKISTTIAKDSVDYKYLQLAVNAGIIDNSGEFKPSDLVTREQASMYLVKLLHYDKIGKLKDAFNFQPADKSSISTDYVGYVSLAKTLGLLDVDSNNNIRPNDNITMEEMVKSIYGTLQ
jgi:hypothetical protein